MRNISAQRRIVSTVSHLDNHVNVDVSHNQSRSVTVDHDIRARRMINRQAWEKCQARSEAYNTSSNFYTPPLLTAAVRPQA